MVLCYVRAQQQGINVDGNAAMPAAVKSALQKGAAKFTSAGSVSKIPGGRLDALATVRALDIAGLQNLQKTASTAKASAGITIAALVLGAVVGSGTTMLAEVVRLNFKKRAEAAARRQETAAAV